MLVGSATKATRDTGDQTSLVLAPAQVSPGVALAIWGWCVPCRAGVQSCAEMEPAQATLCTKPIAATYCWYL